MKKIVILLFVLFTFLVNSSVFATSIKITLESYDPATLPKVSEIIDIPDINDQLEISRQAGLLALSNQGWNLAFYSGWLQYREPPDWSGYFYFADISITGQDYSLLKNLFGYELNQESLTYGPHYYLFFHTDELIGRFSHNVGEPSGFGVIGLGSGGMWSQSIVQEWGQFYVEEVNGVPEPTTIFLLGLGLMGLAGIRRKF